MAEVLRIGTKVEISLEAQGTKNVDEDIVSYISKIQDIFPNGDLEMDMPMHQRRLVLLHNGVRYRLVFYNGTSTYVAIGEVIDRYKSNNQYLVRVALKSNLTKFQRREYFRCECLIDLLFHDVDGKNKDEVQLQEMMHEYSKQDMSDSMDSGLILDISGGGVRFVSKKECQAGELKRMVFHLPIDGRYKEFCVLGKIIECSPVKDSATKHESRVKFLHIGSQEREEIIKFIFEEERKSRKLSRG